MWLRIMDVLENSNEWILKSSTKRILVVIIVSIKGKAKSSNIGIPSNYNIQLHSPPNSISKVDYSYIN